MGIIAKDLSRLDLGDQYRIPKKFDTASSNLHINQYERIYEDKHFEF
jgi:hypothetical protein